MGSFADYLENKILDYVFGATAFTAPANIYIALSTTAITDAGGNLTEPSGGNYSRKSVANNKTTWATSSGGSLSNAIQIDFAQASASWGQVVDFALMDASSGGNMLAYGTLTTAKTIDNGDTASFAAGQLTLTLN